MEFYSAIMRNKIMSFAGKWMELKNVMLSEINQSHKDKHYIFCLMWRIKREKERHENKRVRDLEKGGEGGEKIEGNRGGEYNQSTSYAYMEVSQ
jgi:hypothetical protein